MAKPTALDAKIQEIDAAMASCHAELNRLREIREFLTGDPLGFAPPADAPKPKRGRGKGKKGLPAVQPEQEAGQF